MGKKKSQIDAEKGALNVQCRFNGLSIGEDVSRLSLEIDRSKINIAQAEEFLCCKRLKVEINLEDPEQPELPGIEQVVVEGVADTRAFSVSKKKIGTGLTFNNATEQLMMNLTKFVKRPGRFYAEIMEDLGAEKDGEEEAA